MSVRPLHPPYSTVVSLVATTIICVGCAVPVPPPNQRTTVGPRPTSEAQAGETPRLRASREAQAQARVNAPSAQTPRRYTLNIDDLISKSEGGEIETIGPFNPGFPAKPSALTVMQQIGYQRQWKNVPLPGLESQPLYLNCVYQMIDRGNPNDEKVITRDVKFWYGQRPAIGSVGVYSDLIGLKLADVAVERCPNNWGEALATAMGPEIWSKVKTRPYPNAPRAQPAPTIVAGGASAQSTTVPLPAVTTAPDGRALSAIEKCDKSAAHTDDPEAFSEGVSDEQLNEQFVITACEEAVKMDKNSPRLAFQLARGYLKSSRVEDAIEQLLAAAKMGHGASLAYLADIHLDGAPGIEADPNLARSLYEKAVQSGFVAAKKILAEFEDYTEKVAAAEKEEKSGRVADASGGKLQIPFVPPGTDYRVSLVMDNIMKGDLNAVGYTEIWSKFFLVEVSATIGYFCQNEFTQDDIQRLERQASLVEIDKSSGGGFVMLLNGAEDMIMMMANPKSAIEAERQKEVAGEQVRLNRSEEAAHDGIVFLSRYGCVSEQMKTFRKHSASFIAGEGAVPLNADTVFQSCVAHRPNGNRVLRMQFCACVTRKIATARVTRAERVSLMSSFMPAAQTIANKQLEHFQSCR